MCQRVSSSFECGHENPSAKVDWVPKTANQCPYAIQAGVRVTGVLRRCLPGNNGNYTTALFVTPGVCKDCWKVLQARRNTWCPRCRIFLPPSDGDLHCDNCEFVLKKGAEEYKN